MKKNCSNCKNLGLIKSSYPTIIDTEEGECYALYKILHTEKRIFIRKKYLDNFCCIFHRK